jgi:endo-1,4-beta-D-glucanase Y
MKKYMKISALVLTGILLAARIDSIWTHFFTPGDISKYDADGEKCVYYEVGDSMGIIVDTGSNDVRTEGMSYGMMETSRSNADGTEF